MSYNQRDYIDQALRPLVAALRNRYPGVRIVWAHYVHTHWGELQQCVRFQAPLEVLRHGGLVSDSMIAALRGTGESAQLDGRRRPRTTECGDSCSLHSQFDQASRPGYFDLIITSSAIGTDWRTDMSLREAARALRRIAKCRHLDEGEGAP